MELREEIAKELAYIGNSTNTETLSKENLWYWFSNNEQAYWKRKVDIILVLIEEAGYVKLADIDYRYLPTKECYCYDNGWRKIEV